MTLAVSARYAPVAAAAARAGGRPLGTFKKPTTKTL
jgi:hypothetical protein